MFRGRGTGSRDCDPGVKYAQHLGAPRFQVVHNLIRVGRFGVLKKHFGTTHKAKVLKSWGGLPRLVGDRETDMISVHIDIDAQDRG